MISLPLIESSIRNAIEYVKARKKGSEYESLLTYLSIALDELMKAKPVKVSGEVTCSTGDKTCPFLWFRRLGDGDYFCTAFSTAPHDVFWLFYGDDGYLVPCESCVWSKNECAIK